MVPNNNNNNNNNNNGICSSISTKWLFIHFFQIQLEFRSVDFCGGRKTREPRGFIKGRAPDKLTGCEQDLAINLPGCFCLLLLSFMRKARSAWLKNPTDLLHKTLMKPLRTQRKTLIARTRTDNKLNPHVTLGPGIIPGPPAPSYFCVHLF